MVDSSAVELMGNDVVDTEMKKRNATIHDVADVAGVAIGTVSRYLNGFEVRRGNRVQIEQAIEKLSFQRNAAARAMKSDKTDIIGFLVPTFDEFHAQLLNHLASAFRQTGRTLLTYCHEGNSQILKEAIAFFSNQRVDALVMAGSLDTAEEVGKLVARDIPVVIYNNDVLGLQVDRIFVENMKASQRAVRQLIDVGHTRIAAVHGQLDESTGVERLEGYRRALADASIEYRADYTHPGNWTVEGGYSAIQKFMAMPDPPTAVFSANYRMTTGILEWVREHARRVPEDFAIVSFDDVELFRLYDGGITAVAQPIEKISETIVSYAISRLTETGLPDTRTRSLDCNIVLRASSGPSRGSRVPQ